MADENKRAGRKPNPGPGVVQIVRRVVSVETLAVVPRLKQRYLKAMEDGGETMESIAAQLGVSTMSVSRWLQSDQLTDDQFRRLCEAVGWEPEKWLRAWSPGS